MGRLSAQHSVLREKKRHTKVMLEFQNCGYKNWLEASIFYTESTIRMTDFSIAITGSKVQESKKKNYFQSWISNQTTNLVWYRQIFFRLTKT